MARRKAVEIVIADGTCACGCGESVTRTFRQGHDQRLKGILGRAHRAGDPVRIVADGKRTTASAAALLEARGWPVPAA
jgi:hypothetical protein